MSLERMPFSLRTLKKSSDLRNVIVKSRVFVFTFCSKRTSRKNSCVVMFCCKRCTMSIIMILTDFWSSLDRSSASLFFLFEPVVFVGKAEDEF